MFRRVLFPAVCQYVLNRSLSKVGLLLSITPLSSDTPVQVSQPHKPQCDFLSSLCGVAQISYSLNLSMSVQPGVSVSSGLCWMWKACHQLHRHQQLCGCTRALSLVQQHNRVEIEMFMVCV